jgi:beta-phosphoglucomutase family hydrolase
VLGLPDNVRICLFDLDGVLTRTAEVHAAAWKETFDDYLRERSARTDEPFIPFDRVSDYAAYVDGRRRDDGVRSFLCSRHIDLPRGLQCDPPGAETLRGLGNRKNQLLLSLIRGDGVRPYEGSVRYVRAARDAGLPCAVVSSSTNSHEVLVAAGIDGLFETVIGGAEAQRDRLRGKPAPDTFLAGARALGAEPPQAAVFEDALAGVAAGRAGGFGFVVGVARSGQREALLAQGADVAVSDLDELLAQAQVPPASR